MTVEILIEMLQKHPGNAQVYFVDRQDQHATIASPDGVERHKYLNEDNEFVLIVRETPENQF